MTEWDLVEWATRLCRLWNVPNPDDEHIDEEIFQEHRERAETIVVTKRVSQSEANVLAWAEMLEQESAAFASNGGGQNGS